MSEWILSFSPKEKKGTLGYLFVAGQRGGHDVVDRRLHDVVGVDKVVPRKDHVELPEPDVLAPMHGHGLVQPHPILDGGRVGVGSQQKTHGDVQNGRIFPQPVDRAQVEHSGGFR